MVLLKEVLKAQVAAYKEAIEEAVKVVAEAAANIAVNAVAEAPLEELGGLGKPVVIEPDNNKTKSNNKDAYATFKEAIKVEDYEASYIEAL
jgi:hypothetical protein